MSSRNCGSEEYYKTHASQLTDNLFLAACRAVTSKCLLELGITNIVNATLELPTVAYQQQDTIQIAVEDRITAKLNIYFDLIADKIEEVHHGGGKILVYCRAGQSRSATLCIAYFMKYHGMSYEQAFQFVKYRRPIIHPNLGFVHQLRDYEKKLKARIPPVRSCAPLRVLFGEENSLEADDDVENDVIDIPIPPIKHGRATAALHEPFKSLTDKYEIVAVQICDRNSFKSKRAPLQDRSSLNIQPGHGVASASFIPKTVGAVKELETNRGKRKTAFTRLAKPAEIAVSLLDIPLDLALADNNSNKFKLQTKAEHSSAITELLHPLEISEGFPVESVRDSQKILETPVKANKIVTELRRCVTQQLTCHLESNKPITGDQAAPPAKSRQRQNSVKTRSLVRSGASGYSLAPSLAPLAPVTRLSPGRKVRVGEEQQQPCKAVLVRTAQQGLEVRQPQAWLNLAPLPSFSVSIDCYHKLDFSFASFTTSCIASAATQQVMGNASVDVGQTMTISKEFPYYSTVHFTSALELFRATENARLDIQWFKLPAAVKADPVELVRKTSEARMAERRKKSSQLDLKWATDRFQTDEFQKPLPCLAVTQFSSCTATSVLHRRTQEAYTLTQLVDYFKLDLIGRFYVPHYNAALLRKNCDYVLHPVAEITIRPILEMTNIYSAPRAPHFKAVARKNLHLDFLLAATTLNADIRNDKENIENIPDEIHDISEMKNVLAEKTSSPRCKIWFEVFKRTLMKKRPTYANVSYSRFLSTPASWQPLLLECLVTAVDSTTASKVLEPANKSALCIASTREVRVIERGAAELPHKSNTRPGLKRRKFSDRFVSPCEYSQDSINEAMETTSHLSAPGLANVLFGRAVSKVSFPNRLYAVGEERVYGQVGKYSPNAVAFSRVPFSVITRLRPVSDNHLPLSLWVTASLPEYKFVGDVEDQADLSLHKVTVCEVAQLTETDSFWFFALDSAATETNNPANFLLFLPDRKLASKIGQEELPDITETFNPDAVVAEVISEIKEQTSEKKVTFSTDLEGEDPEESQRKLKVKTIYYGRDRSKSRTRLKDVETGKRVRRRDRSASCYNEAEIMKNLERSVDEANSILLRRRDEGGSSSRHSERMSFSPDRSPQQIRSPRLETRSEERFARRSRDAQRNKEETERRERSRKSDQSNVPNQPPPLQAQPEDPGGAKTLAGGIISFASNLITGRARRENSETRARGLLRKSARNFL